LIKKRKEKGEGEVFLSSSVRYIINKMSLSLTNTTNNSDSEQILELSFKKNTADHQMTIIHNDRLYRNILFSAPKTMAYSYNLHTWPGHLAITGDIGDGYMFRRLPDMFQFFATGEKINPQYWSEKCIASKNPIMKYDVNLFHQAVAERLTESYSGLEEDQLIKLRKEWEDHLKYRDYQYSQEEAYNALSSFCGRDGYQFTDIWEMDFKNYDPGFLIACYAIKSGVTQFLNNSNT
jgi:hypothetical protein